MNGIGGKKYAKDKNHVKHIKDIEWTIRTKSWVFIQKAYLVIQLKTLNILRSWIRYLIGLLPHLILVQIKDGKERYFLL